LSVLTKLPILAISCQWNKKLHVFAIGVVNMGEEFLQKRQTLPDLDVFGKQYDIWKQFCDKSMQPTFIFRPT
jgi:hypothetical protein